MSSSLANISKAATALASAKSLEDVLEIRDKAEAIRMYVRAVGESLVVQNHAAEIKLRAERKAGELLLKMEKQNGARDGKRSDIVSPRLEEVGVTRKQSSRWQAEAKVPEKQFQKLVEECNEEGKELTQAALINIAKRNKKDAVVASSSSDAAVVHESGCVVSFDDLAGRKFGTVYADPPWKYGNQGTRASTDNHYSTMSVDDLCEMPVSELVADDAHLHLWTTNAFLFEAKRLIDAWGFEYKSCFVWVKPQIGIGNYWRVSHEFMLLGVRGNAKRFGRRDLPSWINEPRGKHSAKPEKVRKLIEQCSPGPFLELFGRSPIEGWTVFGNQIQTELVGK